MLQNVQFDCKMKPARLCFDLTLPLFLGFGSKYFLNSLVELDPEGGDSSPWDCSGCGDEMERLLLGLALQSEKCVPIQDGYFAYDVTAVAE